MTNLEKLRILGEAIHGDRWMRATAHDLGINPRTVLRWNAGESAPSDAIIAEMSTIAFKREDAIKRARQVVRAGKFCSCHFEDGYACLASRGNTSAEDGPCDCVCHKGINNDEDY